MKPVLFQWNGIAVHSYGLMIALGVIIGAWYLEKQGKKEIGITSNQVSLLIVLLFAAAFIGGKLFLFFEGDQFKASDFFSGSGFVFYGSFIMAVPVMLWYFRKQQFPILQTLDIMAVTTCIVHAFGRIGCFMAGCCYGKPTYGHWGVQYSDPGTSAEPLHTYLHPVQLYEASYILVVGLLLLLTRTYFRKFYGQLFLTYLLLYAIGRAILENYRGDYVRGYVFGSVSNAQFTAFIITVISIGLYTWLQRSGKLLRIK
ncbi:MAG TPA: prolipoprotein diacylglyceryl transferase [Flavisolibacter sp.]|nr:prolipoprotein diacylglyceryl transferase [Flavisolibacter sp.]